MQSADNDQPQSREVPNQPQLSLKGRSGEPLPTPSARSVPMSPDSPQAPRPFNTVLRGNSASQRGIVSDSMVDKPDTPPSAPAMSQLEILKSNLTELKYVNEQLKAEQHLPLTAQTPLSDSDFGNFLPQTPESVITENKRALFRQFHLNSDETLQLRMKLQDTISATLFRQELKLFNDKPISISVPANSPLIITLTGSAIVSLATQRLKVTNVTLTLTTLSHGRVWLSKDSSGLRIVASSAMNLSIEAESLSEVTAPRDLLLM